MHQTDRKKIIILIVIVIIVAFAGVALYYSQKNSQSLTPPINQKYEQLTAEQKEKLAQAEQATKDKPNDINSLINLANLQNQLGWTEEAIKTYEKALAINPTEILTLNNLANIYINLKQYEKAEELFLKIINNYPRWVQTYTDLVDLYRFNLPDKRDKIPEILQKGYENNPEKQAVFLRYLAAYHKDFGDKEKAIKNYQELLKIELDNITAKEELEELLKNK
jgi:tetratricopeptide (TPR) repeat protein